MPSLKKNKKVKKYHFLQYAVFHHSKKHILKQLQNRDMSLMSQMSAHHQQAGLWLCAAFLLQKELRFSQPFSPAWVLAAEPELSQGPWPMNREGFETRQARRPRVRLWCCVTIPCDTG